MSDLCKLQPNTCIWLARAYEYKEKLIDYFMNYLPIGERCTQLIYNPVDIDELIKEYQEDFKKFKETCLGKKGPPYFSDNNDSVRKLVILDNEGLPRPTNRDTWAKGSWLYLSADRPVEYRRVADLKTEEFLLTKGRFYNITTILCVERAYNTGFMDTVIFEDRHMNNIRKRRLADLKRDPSWREYSILTSTINPEPRG
jgi:hypothetical protein